MPKKKIDTETLELIDNWVDTIKNKDFEPADVERSLRYAKDLENGLDKIRTYPQGVTVFGSARIQTNSKWYKLAGYWL